MEHCPSAEQIADAYARQLGLGPFVIFRTRFMGLVPYLLS